MDVEIVTLENNMDYYVIKEINNYLYLVNTQNKKDICIRKNVNKDGKDFIETLDNENELMQALALFKEN